jgi:steroid delta-isomerase-like uncharacterized protein
MGAAENLAVHRAWGDAENQLDVTHHSDFLHPDIEVTMPGTPPLIGLEEYRSMMQSSYEGLKDWHFVIDDRFATDDRVVCRWRVSGVHQAEYFGYPPTGKHVEFNGMSLWEFDGGKARRGWIYPDLAAIMAQFST